MFIRFIFEHGDSRIEEIDEDDYIVNTIRADFSTILGYFDIAKQFGISKIKTLMQLEQIVETK